MNRNPYINRSTYAEIIKKPKYGNSKVIFDGMEFDSEKEASRWAELKLLERSGVISDLQRQVKYQLIPALYDEVNGRRVCIERECSYIADFVYRQDDKIIVEDTKSEATKTKDYIIKRKLMLFLKGIRIKEV